MTAHERAIERVARHAHAADRQHVGQRKAPLSHHHQAIVRRAAAKIADQHQRVAGELITKVAGGRHRLRAKVHCREAREQSGLTQPLLREGIILRVGGKASRPPQKRARHPRPEVTIGALAHLPQHDRDQLLERIGARVDLRAHEAPHRQETLQ
jgi:hypothetical protein